MHMRKSKLFYKECLQADCVVNIGRSHISSILLFFKLIFKSESGMAYDYLKSLRAYEYALNKPRNMSSRLIIIYRQLIWHRKY